MYLESLTIYNYRKFREQHNTIKFVQAKPIHSLSGQNIPIQSLVSESSTLIIGKNNAGKTTISRAIDFIWNYKSPKASDFNIYYLKETLKKYLARINNPTPAEPPKIEFILKIKLDETSQTDLINNFSSFICLGNDSLEEPIVIKVTYELKDTLLFYDNLKKIFDEVNLSINTENKTKSQIEIEKFNKQLEAFYFLLNDNSTEFQIIYKNINNHKVNNFNPKNLFGFKEIKADRRLSNNALSSVFKKVVSSQFQDDGNKLLKDHIQDINQKITNHVQKKNDAVSNILQTIEQSNHVGMKLTGNVTKEVILNNLIKYNFLDGDDFIPEDQFGLGYINLLNVIGEIVHYIDDYKENCHKSCINLLFIEEPEAFMHPQMQELFITCIDKAVKKALDQANQGLEKSKSLQCQVVITTHSSHIVNSKIHSCNSLNNINYVTNLNKHSVVLPLNDEIISGNNSVNNIKFLKKHIKYKVSELFFSDAIIFVEGVTEETLLNYYLEQNQNLNSYHISIFRIDGAHSKIYFPLIKALKIPCLVITDLDIKREPCEKNQNHKNSKNTDNDCPICHYDSTLSDYVQITTPKGRMTTNQTLIEAFYKKLENETEKTEIEITQFQNYFEEDNLYIVFQKTPIESVYASSFEEAMILANLNNQIIHNVLSDIRPNIYKEITDNGKDKHNLKNKTYRLQHSLNERSGKSEFANSILYELITKDGTDKPVLPTYIQDGLSWLTEQLANEV